MERGRTNRVKGNFKMKGFPIHKGVSPMKQTDATAAGKGNYDAPTTTTTTTPTVVEEETKEKESGTGAGNLPKIITTPATNEEGAVIGDKLDKDKEDTEKEKLKAQSKKEMYANAWQDSGAGHIVEAVKSIRRGIKNLKAKKAKRVEGAKAAVSEGTETLKQAKLVKRAKKKEDRVLKRKIKDQKKLKKFREKNPVTGKEAIKLATGGGGGKSLV